MLIIGELINCTRKRIAKAVEGCLVEEMEDLDRVIVHVDPVVEDHTLLK